MPADDAPVRKRHTVVDTIGLVVHAADIQDRDGAPAVLASIRKSCPWLRQVFADGGYNEPKLRGALDRIGGGRGLGASSTVRAFAVSERAASRSGVVHKTGLTAAKYFRTIG